MEACRKDKKFCEFEQSLARNKKYTWDFCWDKSIAQCKIFPAKRLGTFFTQNQTPFKSADLFFLGQFFPPKDLIFFRLFSVPFKSAIVFYKKILPPNDLVFFFDNFL